MHLLLLFFYCFGIFKIHVQLLLLFGCQLWAIVCLVVQLSTVVAVGLPLTVRPDTFGG